MDWPATRFLNQNRAESQKQARRLPVESVGFNAMAMFWSCAQVESLRERTAQRWLEPEFETYLPVIRAANSRIVPLFPNYLFVRLGEFRWSAVDNTIGVIKLLRSGERPAELKDETVDAIKSRERDGIVRLPKPRGLLIGDRVRLVRGSFADHIGLYDGMDARQRVFVLLELFGRKTRTEVAAGDFRIV
jgi:transcriptional antiterminator RfaH